MCIYQVLTQNNVCDKYAYKYIGGIDENNYVVILTDIHQNGALVSQSTFMHNTNISSLKKNEEDDLKNKYIQSSKIQSY